jgi:SAM-dependent methyltransferase
VDLSPSAAELLAWLASLPPRERDGALEARFGIAAALTDSSPPGEDLIGYHASGVAAVVRALVEAPVTQADVFVDLGSGLGKVVLLTALLTGATARGIELQAGLVERARRAATRLGIHVRFDVADARDAEVEDGTVFFLYAPFTGHVLSVVLERLHAVAKGRALVVCALGVDLDHVSWLARRELDAFWLSVYDSVVPGALPRRSDAVSAMSPDADTVAREAP